MRPYRSIPITLFCALGLVAHGQLNTQSGTAITVDASTSLRIDEAVIWSIASGANVVNNGEITLMPLASIDEALGSPIVGAGTERITMQLNGPLVGLDPGTLGIRITTNTTLGSTQVERGHLPWTDYSGHTSIARWYRVSPTANAGLNATVGFRYDPVELNGVPETAQVLHIHMHDAVWHFLNGAVNTPQHLVTAAALDSLGLFTTYNGDLPTTVASAAHEDRMFLSPNIGETITLHVPDGMHATSVAIVDAKGASIREWSVALLTGDHVLPVADLASGVYRLRINGDTSIPFVRP